MSKKNDPASTTLKRAELNLHGKLNHYLLTRYPHHVVPGFNLNKTPWVQQWDFENVMKLYRRFPYRSDLPKPLLPPAKLPKSVTAYGDPATDIIVTKSYIEEDVNKILDNFQKHQNEHTPQMKKDLRWVKTDDKMESIMPRYIADMADIIEMDPDVHFEGKYNWYYSGGTLDTVSFAGQVLLFFPYVGELVASPLCSKDNSIWKPTLKNAAKCKIDDALYELKHNVTSESCRILARFKYECSFYSITETDNQLYMITLDSRTSKIPYISADLNSFDLNQYCTLSIGRLVEFWDMVSGKCMTKGTITSTKCLDDEWGCVRHQTFNPNIVTFADRCCLHYLDSRMPLESPVLSMCPKFHMETCEDISLCFASDRQSRCYLGTTHHLLLCDDRSPEQCVHQKWTHQFRSPPMFGSTLMRSGEEIVTIASQIPSDMAVILNSWENYDDPHSYCLPHKPPCMIDTLGECQSLGKCLDPSLRSRLDLSTVGCQLLMNDSQDVFIFSQNSIGDVYYQCITHNEEMENLPLINSHAYYALETWERHILERGPGISPLVLTDQVNMEHISNVFLDSSRKFIPGPQKEIVLDSWRQPLDKLTCYVDILAPELLAAWEISEESESVPEAAPHQKVLSWLEMSNPKPPTTQSQESQEPLEEPLVSLTPMESQELVSVSQQCREVIDIDTGEIAVEPVYPPLKMKTKRKDVKKKVGYVAGF